MEVVSTLFKKLKSLINMDVLEKVQTTLWRQLKVLLCVNPDQISKK